MAKVVLDFSKWNAIDKSHYTIIAKECDGIILRIGYRSLEKGIITEDPKFKTHLDALKNICPIGVYFFTTAITEAEAVEEAQWTINTCKKYNVPLSFPIAVDTEFSNNTHTGRSDKLGKDVRTANVVAFCKECERQGYRPMIYASDSWFVSELNYNAVKDYMKWVARYSNKKPEKVKDNIAGWQKMDNYPVAGKYTVDMSEWYAPISRQYAKISPVNTVENLKVEKIILKDAFIYAASTSPTPTRKISGGYYIWNDEVVNGRIRITSKKEYVGVAGKVTGWVSAVQSNNTAESK